MRKWCIISEEQFLSIALVLKFIWDLQCLTVLKTEDSIIKEINKLLQKHPRSIKLHSIIAKRNERYSTCFWKRKLSNLNLFFALLKKEIIFKNYLPSHCLEIQWEHFQSCLFPLQLIIFVYACKWPSLLLILLLTEDLLKV